MLEACLGRRIGAGRLHDVPRPCCQVQPEEVVEGRGRAGASAKHKQRVGVGVEGGAVGVPLAHLDPLAAVAAQSRRHKLGRPDQPKISRTRKRK